LVFIVVTVWVLILENENVRFYYSCQDLLAKTFSRGTNCNLNFCSFRWHLILQGVRCSES